MKGDNIMKRKLLSIICLIALLCMTLASCESRGDDDYPPCGGVIFDDESSSELEFEASGEYGNGNRWFLGEVLEVSEGLVLVRPHEDSAEIRSADKINVSTNLKDGGDLPPLKVGSIVRVVYDGAIAESYPAQIHSTVRIEVYYASDEIVGIIKAGYVDNEEIYTTALNAELLGSSEEKHYPIHRIGSVEELRTYLDRCATIVSPTDDTDRLKCMAEDMLLAKYDSEFFSENELLIAYIVASSGSYRYSAAMYPNETNNALTMLVTEYLGALGSANTCDMAGWFAVAERTKGTIPEGTAVDAIRAVGSYGSYSYVDSEWVGNGAVFSLWDDGRYSMAFGILSSHIGMGTYKIKDGYLYLTESNSQHDAKDTYVFSLSEDYSKAVFVKEMSTGRSWYSSFTDGSEFLYVKRY